MIRAHLKGIAAEMKLRVRKAWFWLTAKDGTVVTPEFRKTAHVGTKAVHK